MVRGARRPSRRVLLTLAVAGAALVAVGAAGGGVGTGPPVIDKTVTGTEGQNGWYVSNAQVQWTVTGSEPMTKNGCADETFTDPGGTSSCEASNLEGSASDSVTVKVDTQEPSLGLPADIDETTNDSSGKVINYSVSSDGSVNCSPASGTKFPAGQTTTVSCTATDQAGNTRNGSFKVKITFVDPTPPVIQEQVSGTVGSNGWYRSDVTVTWTVTDPESTPTSCPADTIGEPGGSASCAASSAGGSSSKTVGPFKVDKTAPSITVPGNITAQATSASGAAVSFSATASDNLSGASVACTPASGSTFPLGTKPVACTATDGAGNSSSGNFSVTIVDTVKPVLIGVPGAITAEATSPAGAAVSYTNPGATDNAGPATVTCAPPSGSTFPLGASTVTCSARDGSGNQSDPGSFQITVRDSVAPAFAPKATETVQATAAAGTVVNYSPPTATDAVDKTLTITCTPGPGSAFPLGSTTVTCTARDDTGNQSTTSFSVIIVDTTPPVVTVPGARSLEANGPGGSASNFAGEVSASDLGEPVPPARISCTPAPGSTFGLGTSTVTCTATDAVGNKGTGTFTIKVTDNTPPVLHAPSEAAFFADAPSGISADHPAVQRFLRSPVAQDIVDEAVSISHNAPAVFPMGDTNITFRAVDDAGNTSTQNARVNVKPRPADQPTGQPALQTADLIPPQNPRGVGASSTPGSITINWQPVSDAEQYEVYRSTSDRSLQGTSDTPNGTLVYRGKATRFKDSRVTGGVEYRYVIVAVDKAGNRSVGEVVVAVGKQLLLLRPARGARSAKPPVLVLARVPGATYYNIQLFRGTQKILSVWPSGTSYTLRLTWRYGGRPYRLSPGVYRWYAWPGLGRREDARYGAVMGESAFTIVPAKKATAKKAKKKAPKGKKASTAKRKASPKKRKR
jgi:hypothetical protein